MLNKTYELMHECTHTMDMYVYMKGNDGQRVRKSLSHSQSEWIYKDLNFSSVPIYAQSPWQYFLKWIIVPTQWCQNIPNNNRVVRILVMCSPVS